MSETTVSTIHNDSDADAASDSSLTVDDLSLFYSEKPALIED